MNSVYQFLIPVGEVDWIRKWTFDCTPKLNLWRSAGELVEVYNPEKPPCDFPFLTDGVLPLSARARLLLGDFITDGENELLPLQVNGSSARYSALNILPCSDCLDLERTTWHSLPSRERWRVSRFQFDKSCLPNRPLFKVSAAPYDVFASDDFKAFVESQELTGLTFQEVWNDDGTSLPELL